MVVVVDSCMLYNNGHQVLVVVAAVLATDLVRSCQLQEQ